jgi:hypothetical protein
MQNKGGHLNAPGNHRASTLFEVTLQAPKGKPFAMGKNSALIHVVTESKNMLKRN